MGKRYLDEGAEHILDSECKRLAPLLHGASVTDSDALRHIMADAARYRELMRDQARRRGLSAG